MLVYTVFQILCGDFQPMAGVSVEDSHTPGAHLHILALDMLRLKTTRHFLPVPSRHRQLNGCSIVCDAITWFLVSAE